MHVCVSARSVPALRGLFEVDWRALGRDPLQLEAAHAAEHLQLVEGDSLNGVVGAPRAAIRLYLPGT